MPANSPPSDQYPTSNLHSARAGERILSLLDTVANAGAVSLTAAASQVELPTSTALRHLRLLTNHGYLIRDEQGLYSLGPALLRIALASQQRGPYARLINAAQASLAHLVDVTEESAYLAVRDGGDAVYIATAESRRAIRHVGWVGRTVTLEGTAVGEALLSEPEPQQPRVSVKTGAIEPDVTAVVSPICSSQLSDSQLSDLQQVVGALSVLGPTVRLSGDQLRSVVLAVADAATEVSRALGLAEMAQP